MISVIIPTYNEKANIGKLIRHLYSCSQKHRIEIIVTDGGSSDQTVAIAKSLHAKTIVSSLKGRACQMNAAAKLAAYDIFYFVHADSLPPASFCDDIAGAVANGFGLGRYCTKFEGNRLLLKINAFFTRFDWFVCYGGDQTLFVTRELFNHQNGYNNELHIMEEYDFVTRARQYSRYKIFPKTALVSTRKYQSNSWWKVQRANYKIVQSYKKGMSQENLKLRYHEMLNGIK